MRDDRRQFLKQCGTLGAMGAIASGADASHAPAADDAMGVLVDLTQCIGCRLCEYACKKSNGIEAGTLASYDDQSVFAGERRPDINEFTVVNAYPGAAGKPVYAKVNCMHCNHAACVSACIVGALQKQPNGAVTYDAWKCIGCRYCMVACPFQIPAYEYGDVLTPEVRKCEFCNDRLEKGDQPACVAECPRDVLTFGRRADLLKLAHKKIGAHPANYIDQVYGEHEVGGTSWMYISNVPFEKAGLLKLGHAAPPALTEAIQHGVFKHWIAPLGWYGFLAGSMWWTGRRHRPARVSVLESSSSSCGAVCEENHEVGAGSSHSAAVAHVHEHEHAEPVARKLLTPGVWALIAMVVTGGAFMLYRFFFGLAASTNLDQQHPWGLWIAMDVGSGIALAGGGFITAAIVHIFHREHYHAVARSALLTALLGYTFYVPGLLADIGRWYNIWHPLLPNMWQGNSVLFEVGLCVMIYLNVQYIELAPIVCERLMKEEKWPRARKMARWAHGWLEWMMPAFLVLGVALSTFHQSSLGNLMVIAPSKVHPLWWTPVSPILFLLSAAMVGLPMVIFTMLFASWCLKRKAEMHVLAPLARYIPVLLAAYLALRVGDLIARGVAPAWDLQGACFVAEMLIGVIEPLFLLLIPAVRRSPVWLGVSCLMVILGVVINRLNVFVIGYHPPYATKTYIPSLTEFMVSMGLVAALLLCYRIAVTYLPILPAQKKEAA